MFVADTNVLVYAANQSAPAHQPCRALLEQWRNQPGAWYLTWPIVYEFLRIVTHPRVLRTPWTATAAWSFVQSVRASPGSGMLLQTERHESVCRQVLAETPLLAGNILHDVHTAVLMREHGVRTIYTRDTDFHRFAFLEVLDPVVAAR